jgi:hypothetical protein
LGVSLRDVPAGASIISASTQQPAKSFPENGMHDFIATPLRAEPNRRGPLNSFESLNFLAQLYAADSIVAT